MMNSQQPQGAYVGYGGNNNLGRKYQAGNSYFNGFQPYQPIDIYGSGNERYEIQRDDQVPDLKLTKQKFREFQKMENYFRNNRKWNPNTQAFEAVGNNDDLKQLLLYQTLNVNPVYLKAFKRQKGIPEGNNEVYEILCDYYSTHFQDSPDEFKFWLGRTLKSYTTHKYPGVTTQQLLNLVSFYLVKCHEEAAGDLQNQEEWKIDVNGRRVPVQELIKKAIRNTTSLGDNQQRGDNITRQAEKDRLDALAAIRASATERNRSAALAGEVVAFDDGKRKRKRRKSKSKSKSKKHDGKRSKRSKKSKKIEKMMVEMGLKPKRKRSKRSRKSALKH